MGFADAAVKTVIGGSAAEYNAFKTWADGVKGATGDVLAGEEVVVANAYAAAYLFGAERLFENEPTVEIGEMAVTERSSGTLDPTVTVSVSVKDGDREVAVDAAKVAAMFEATSDLGDWMGSAKLVPVVTIVDNEGVVVTQGTDAASAFLPMRFTVSLDGSAPRAFLRIRK